MPTPMRSLTVATYATGERRTRAGLFGLAVCEIRVEEPEGVCRTFGISLGARHYWKRANAAEWEWCGRRGKTWMI